MFTRRGFATIHFLKKAETTVNYTYYGHGKIQLYDDVFTFHDRTDLDVDDRSSATFWSWIIGDDATKDCERVEEESIVVSTNGPGLDGGPGLDEDDGARVASNSN